MNDREGRIRIDTRPRSYRRPSVESDPHIRFLRQLFVDRLVIDAPDCGRELEQMHSTYEGVRPALVFPKPLDRYGWFETAFHVDSLDAATQAEVDIGKVREFEQRLREWACRWGVDRSWFREAGLLTLELLYTVRTEKSEPIEDQLAAIERRLKENGIADSLRGEVVAMLRDWSQPDPPRPKNRIAVPLPHPSNLTECEMQFEFSATLFDGESEASFIERLQRVLTQFHRREFLHIRDLTYAVESDADRDETIRWLVRTKTKRAKNRRLPPQPQDDPSPYSKFRGTD